VLGHERIRGHPAGYRCDRALLLANLVVHGGWAVRLLAAVLVLALVAVSPAHAEKRVAFVIGNAAYKKAATLQNPRNDAQDIAEASKHVGFETIVGLDLDESGMKDKSIAFTRAARDADVALVYYSGHAMQFGVANHIRLYAFGHSSPTSANLAQ
jgi:hypothetical protein